MEKFNKIVLNIPHSRTDKGELYWKDKDLIREKIARWTDHKTEQLFNPCNDLRDRVIPIVFPYSRFYVDAERLENDPLENVGQGRIYTNFEGVMRKEIPMDEQISMRWEWIRHRCRLASEIGNDNKTLVIDCHSFPSDLADIDVCIGFNNDETKPSYEFLEEVIRIFGDHGFNCKFNDPYSNSITPPSGYFYKSMMLEINKRCYLDEATHEFKGDFYKIGNAIQSVYEFALSNGKTI